jgi:hypothetical protein
MSDRGPGDSTGAASDGAPDDAVDGTAGEGSSGNTSGADSGDNASTFYICGPDAGCPAAVFPYGSIVCDMSPSTMAFYGVQLPPGYGFCDCVNYCSGSGSREPPLDSSTIDP